MIIIDDTIVAIATARGGSLRGVVRVTGPQTVSTLACVVRSDESLEPTQKQARVISACINAGACLGSVPCELYLWPTNRSYTRQPTAELHTFGSPPVLDAVVASLCRSGARLARPGEFTMRAFLAGRLDLTQAEAVLGVIDARSQKELRVALQQLAGGLAGSLHALRDQLLDLLAHLEAGLDFVEDDIQFITSGELSRQLRAAAQSIEDLLAQIDQRQESGVEPRIVLRGLPNVGKSSLFNALVGMDRSIVAETASTTRDYVSARADIFGRSVLFIDTAGVESGSAQEAIRGAAQRMTDAQSEQATLELFCIDASRPPTAWEQEQLNSTAGPSRLIVLTKCDEPRQGADLDSGIATSSRTGAGLPLLSRAIAQHLDEIHDSESSVVAATASRCADSLRLAAECLSRALELIHGIGAEELIAVELRTALDHLGIVVGTVYTDDILDRVFSRFCIGK